MREGRGGEYRGGDIYVGVFVCVCVCVCGGGGRSIRRERRRKQEQTVPFLFMCSHTHTNTHAATRRFHRVRRCHGSSPLHLAMVSGNFSDEASRSFANEVVPLLLEKGAKTVNAPPGGGGSEPVRSLVLDGASRTCLHLAAAAGLTNCKFSNPIRKKNLLVP